MVVCAREREPNSGIPAALTVDFDYFNLPDVSSDPHRALRKLLNGPELFYTARNGGHWVATSGRLLKQFVENYEVFGNYPAIPKIIATVGAPKMIPEELDPPEHAPYRRIFNVMLSPKSVGTLHDAVTARANALIDQVYAAGRCEFIGDIATPLPVDVFLNFAGLPKTDLSRFMEWVQQINRGTDSKLRTEAHHAAVAYFRNVMKMRRANPGSDIMSQLAQAEIDGHLLSEEDYISMAMILLQGGLDTTTSALGQIMKFLAENPDERRKVVASPDSIPAAIDEMTRWLGVVNNMRTLRQDIEVDGVWMKAEEQVLLPQWLRGIDERMTPGGSTVDLSRTESRSFMFGAGTHRCAGAHLALLELRVFLREWLRRIPDFKIAGKVTTFGGIFMGVSELPLEWPVARQ